LEGGGRRGGTSPGARGQASSAPGPLALTVGSYSPVAVSGRVPREPRTAAPAWGRETRCDTLRSRSTSHPLANSEFRCLRYSSHPEVRPPAVTKTTVRSPSDQGICSVRLATTKVSDRFGSEALD